MTYVYAMIASSDLLQIPAPPEKPLPRVRLLMNGRPLVLTPAIPAIVLTPESIERALTNRNEGVQEPEEVTEECFDVQGASMLGAKPPVQRRKDEEDSALGKDDRSDEGNFWADRAAAVDDGVEDESWEDDEDDLRTLVREIEEDDSNVDKNAPSLPAESGPRPKRPDYTFCPLSHRLSIMRLFAKHASQHSLLPERHGEARSPEQIRRDAVSEMYHHCKANNLCEVWAYLWNSWYSKSRWPLWARSAYATSIPCKRTTMVVEALWRNLKRLVLPMYNRPPVDLCVHAIITQSIPPYRLTLHNILNKSRSSRAATLSHFQEALKHAWKRLTTVPIHGSYVTDLTTFTCDCGAQKYHSYLLCKHLVQGAGSQSPYWWPTVVRYHIPPFYRIPVNGAVPRTPEKLRNHAWLSRMSQTGPSSLSTPLPLLSDTTAEATAISVHGSDSDSDACPDADAAERNADSDSDAVHIPSEVESVVSSRRSSVSVRHLFLFLHIITEPVCLFC